jgi:hypothetical protein
MEYLLGSLVTLLTVVIANKIISKRIAEARLVKTPIYSQSFVHNLMSPYIPTNEELKNQSLKKTQSSKLIAKNLVRVLFTEDKAYWIKDNTVYTANLIDGLVDEESTLRVDMMAMDTVQLKEMSFIVEKLTEGVDDENRYSGK